MSINAFMFVFHSVHHTCYNFVSDYYMLFHIITIHATCYMQYITSIHLHVTG